MTTPFDFTQLDFVVPLDEDEHQGVQNRNVKIYTADLETDPFKAGRYPQPFCAGFYDGQDFKSFWGEYCIDRMFAFLETIEPGIIYFHNGGRFDIYYCMKYITGFPALIINGRIVKTQCKSSDPKRPHEIRDSYAILPFSLSKYKKDEIDITLLEKDVREQHKPKITSYLKGDCVYLHELCHAFVTMFGPKITVGSTAMGELKKLHSFENLGKTIDADIRSKYYYGGRVECFKRGILKGAWKVFDVNSMYPSVMKNFLHPIDSPEADTVKVRKSTCFISAEGKNYGAFPTRTKSNGLRFDIESGLFHVSIHEWEAALSHNLFEPTKIKRCINFRNRGTFAEFVDTFYSKRNKAKIDGDDIHALFYKYILNSAYGKFAQNPAKYLEYTITDATVNLESRGWKAISINSTGTGAANTYIIWKRPPEKLVSKMYNVATGASITGASRAVLMDAIARADTPIYCDTDSIICKGLKGVVLDEEKLGAWKQEATANKACIAGKKLYALFQRGKCVKQANKGVKITAQEIEDVCNGMVVQSHRDAPSFHLDGSYNFISRKVRML